MFCFPEIVSQMETVMGDYIESRVEAKEVQYGHMSNVATTVLDFLKKLNFSQHNDLRQKCKYDTFIEIGTMHIL